MKSFTIDPRRHDGVIFVLDTPAVSTRPEPDNSVMESTLALAHRLRQAGLVTALYSPAGHSIRVLEATGIAEPFTARVERAPRGHRNSPPSATASAC